ncbi:hypothetical protein OH492_28830 [Vibrio chagasii]|nr:hypothetical protein [Vibrio chagasii]
MAFGVLLIKLKLLQTAPKEQICQYGKNREAIINDSVAAKWRLKRAPQPGYKMRRASTKVPVRTVERIASLCQTSKGENTTDEIIPRHENAVTMLRLSVNTRLRAGMNKRES